MKKHLLKRDLKVIDALQGSQIETGSLAEVFSHINDNKHFKQTEKAYLKKILIDNINNAFKREHPPV